MVRWFKDLRPLDTGQADGLDPEAAADPVAAAAAVAAVAATTAQESRVRLEIQMPLLGMRWSTFKRDGVACEAGESAHTE